MTAPTTPPPEPAKDPETTPPTPSEPPTHTPHEHEHEGMGELAKRVDDLEAIVTALVQSPDSKPGSTPWTHKRF